MANHRYSVQLPKINGNSANHIYHASITSLNDEHTDCQLSLDEWTKCL